MNPERHNSPISRMRRVAVWASLLVSAGLAGGECAACSTIVLARGPVLLVGHNLDEQTGFPGFVCVNKRDVFKVGCRWDELRSPTNELSPALCWISSYGSVTFSSLGRDLPDAGVNEAGLAIEEMSLVEGAYPLMDLRPALFQMQWIQYHLDNCRTVEEVIRSASRVVPHGWPWHFLVSDQNGNCATIEYIRGKLIIHTGPTMPVGVLCNRPYQTELDELKRFQGFGGRRRLSPANPKTPRFVRAASLLADFDPASEVAPVDYCFGILENLSGKLTRRSYVIDLRNRIIYFRTEAVPETRYVCLEALDFGSATPVQILDLDVRGAGDVTERFEAYTFEANRRIAEGWVRHVQAMFPDAGETERLAGGYSWTQVDRYARYPETSLTRSELTSGRDRYGLTALYWAALRGELDTAARLISEGAEVNAVNRAGSTALMGAAQTGQLALLHQLLERGASVAFRNQDGEDALSVALLWGQLEVAKALIQAGAPVDARNVHGLTPLFRAASAGDPEVVQSLLSRGADARSKARDGYTPVMAAAGAGHADIIERLLDSGADVDAVTSDGQTALFFAVASGHLRAVQSLVKRGANVNARDAQGQTPLAAAKRNQDREIARCLRK
jgi:ankyrin repeat protein/penicillin V acylase-like amidase (Ntn superfamily)